MSITFQMIEQARTTDTSNSESTSMHQTFRSLDSLQKPLFLGMNDNLQDFLLVTQNEIIFHFINGRVD